MMGYFELPVERYGNDADPRQQVFTERFLARCASCPEWITPRFPTMRLPGPLAGA